MKTTYASWSVVWLGKQFENRSPKMLWSEMRILVITRQRNRVIDLGEDTSRLVCVAGISV